MPFVISKLPMKNLYSVKNGMTGRTTANASTLANAQAQVRLMNSAEYGDAVGGKLLNSAEYGDGNIEGGKLSASDLKGLLDGSYDGRKEHNGFKLDGDLSTDKVKVYYKMEMLLKVLRKELMLSLFWIAHLFMQKVADN